MQNLKINPSSSKNLILRISIDTAALSSTQVYQNYSNERKLLQAYVIGNMFVIDLGPCNTFKNCWIQIKTIVDFRTQALPIQKYKINDTFENTTLGLEEFKIENDKAENFEFVVRNYALKNSL
jgi:hypothetical protein